MATAKTKTATAETATENLQTKDTNEVANENLELKKQLEEMKATIELLQKQYTNQNSVAIEKEPFTKMITFVNLTTGTLVLKGSQTYIIENQFDSRAFTEKEAEVIVNNMNKCVREGCVYICDFDFVRNHSLEDAYANILSAETMRELFNKEPKCVIESYKIATDEQKKIIVDMVIDRKIKGLPVDGNIIVELSKLSGKKLNDIEAEVD